MPRKRNPEALRIEKDYKSKKRKIESQASSARGGQTGRIYTIDKGKTTGNTTGSQKRDPGAHRRTPWTDDRGRVAGEPAKSRISKKKPKTEREYDAKKKLEKDKTPQGTPTFNTNPKNKAPEPAKTKATGNPSTKRVIPRGPKAKPAAAKPATATRKMIIGESSTLKKPDNWKSEKDWQLLEGSPTKKKAARKSPFAKRAGMLLKSRNKKKRKAPTYRG